MTFAGPYTSPFARVSSMAEAIRRRKAQKESERVALAQLPRIRVGVCAMDKKVCYCDAEGFPLMRNKFSCPYQPTATCLCSQLLPCAFEAGETKESPQINMRHLNAPVFLFVSLACTEWP